MWQSGDDFCNLKLTGVTYGGKPGTYTIGLLGKERIRNFGQHGISFNCLVKNKCISKWKPDSGQMRTIDSKAIWYLDIQNRTKTKQLFNNMRSKCDAALEEWHQAQAEEASSPAAQYTDTGNFVRNRAKYPNKWVMPKLGDAKCELRRTHGGTTSKIDLSQVEITKSGGNLIHFQCPGQTKCIDVVGGDDANTSLMELRSNFASAVLPKIEALRDTHPACD